MKESCVPRSTASSANIVQWGCENLVSNKKCKKKCNKGKKCRNKNFCKVNCKKTCNVC